MRFKEILVYNGPGTEASGVVAASLVRALQSLSRRDEFVVSLVDAKELTSKLSETTTSCKSAMAHDLKENKSTVSKTGSDQICNVISRFASPSPVTSKNVISGERNTCCKTNTETCISEGRVNHKDFKLAEDESVTNKTSFSNTVRLLIIPGGRDLPYVDHLNQSRVSLIKQFITTGGSYLGICAGAYFASKHVTFDLDGPLQVFGSRSMALFPGCAIGPTYPGFVYNSTAGARMVPLECVGSLLTGLRRSSCFAYFNGGGYFDLSTETLCDKTFEGEKQKEKLMFDSLARSGSSLNGRFDTSVVHINKNDGERYSTECDRYWESLQKNNTLDTISGCEVLAYYIDDTISCNTSTCTSESNNINSQRFWVQQTLSKRYQKIITDYDYNSKMLVGHEQTNNIVNNSKQCDDYRNNVNIGHQKGLIANNYNNMVSVELECNVSSTITSNIVNNSKQFSHHSNCRNSVSMDHKKRPSIIRRSYGKGKVILTMVHPEMSCQLLNEHDYTARQWCKMENHEAVQYELWTYLIGQLL